MIDRMAMLMVNVISRLTTVQRFNTTPKGQTESVAEHSFCVAFFSYVLHMYLLRTHNIKSDLAKLLSIALVHDMDEAFTGDIVYTVKHETSPDLTATIQKMAQLALSELLADCPVDGMREQIRWHWDEAREVNSVEAKIYKIADVASILYQTNVQESLGNRHFTTIREKAEERFKVMVVKFDFPRELLLLPKAIRAAGYRD